MPERTDPAKPHGNLPRKPRLLKVHPCASLGVDYTTPSYDLAVKVKPFAYERVAADDGAAEHGSFAYVRTAVHDDIAFEPYVSCEPSVVLKKHRRFDLGAVFKNDVSADMNVLLGRIPWYRELLGMAENDEVQLMPGLGTSYDKAMRDDAHPSPALAPVDPSGGFGALPVGKRLQRNVSRRMRRYRESPDDHETIRNVARQRA